MIDQEINKARAVYYGLFSSVLSFLETDKDYKIIKETIEILNKNSLEETSEKALNQMLSFLEKEGFEGLQAESNLVFFSPSTSYIPVTASYYDEARDDGQKRIQMLNYVAESNYRRNTETYKETEDNIGFVLNFMNKLLEDTIKNDKESENLAHKVFENVLNEMIDPFFTNLYNHENSVFYKDLAVLIKVFIEFERHFYNLNKPIEKTIVDVNRPNTKVKKKESVKRAKRNFDEVTSL